MDICDFDMDKDLSTAVSVKLPLDWPELQGDGLFYDPNLVFVGDNLLPKYDYLENNPDSVIIPEHLQSSTILSWLTDLKPAPYLRVHRPSNVEKGVLDDSVIYEENDPSSSFQTAHIPRNQSTECALNV